MNPPAPKVVSGAGTRWLVGYTEDGLGVHWEHAINLLHVQALLPGVKEPVTGLQMTDGSVVRMAGAYETTLRVIHEAP